MRGNLIVVMMGSRKLANACIDHDDGWRFTDHGKMPLNRWRMCEEKLQELEALVAK